jgi:hypothetical protein
MDKQTFNIDKFKKDVENMTDEQAINCISILFDKFENLSCGSAHVTTSKGGYNTINLYQNYDKEILTYKTKEW